MTLLKPLPHGDPGTPGPTWSHEDESAKGAGRRSQLLAAKSASSPLRSTLVPPGGESPHHPCFELPDKKRDHSYVGPLQKAKDPIFPLFKIFKTPTKLHRVWFQCSTFDPNYANLNRPSVLDWSRPRVGVSAPQPSGARALQRGSQEELAGDTWWQPYGDAGSPQPPASHPVALQMLILNPTGTTRASPETMRGHGAPRSEAAARGTHQEIPVWSRPAVPYMNENREGVHWPWPAFQFPDVKG